MYQYCENCSCNNCLSKRKKIIKNLKKIISQNKSKLPNDMLELINKITNLTNNKRCNRRIQ